MGKWSAAKEHEVGKCLTRDAMISWWRTQFGAEELASIENAIADENISMGYVTAQFEKELAAALDVPYAVAVTSGSMALLLAMVALGVEKDDEVIIPNRTFIATAHAALLVGAKVVLVDTKAANSNIDASQIEAKITTRTKAIIPVHLNGRSCDMGEINRIAAKYKLAVIEDAAQAIFSRCADGCLGTLGDVGCFSLGMTKLISSGQGGLVVTRDRETYEKLTLVRNHGVVDTFDGNYSMPGFNGKITDIQSAAGIVQLRKVSEKIVRVIEIYKEYESVMASLPFMELLSVDLEAGEVPLWVEVLCPQREDLVDYLMEHQIQSRNFLPSLHHSKHLHNTGSFFNSLKFERQGLFLPCGPAQSRENIAKVITCLQQYPGT